MSLRLLLGYYKHLLKKSLVQTARITKWRMRGVYIAEGCFIGENVGLDNTAQIRAHSKLFEHVTLGPGVKIGDYCLLSNIRVGENSAIENGVICTGHGKGSIVIGRESYIGLSAVLDWSDDIRIGDFVHIAGPSTGIWTHSSAQACLNNLPLDYKGLEFRPTSPVIVENNVYIGGNCTIYPGVTIGRHSIVAPNSAVTKNVEPYSLVGGVPAKMIRRISNIPA